MSLVRKCAHFIVAQSNKLRWRQEEGQDVAEYAMMLAVLLVVVLSTLHLIGISAGHVFSSVGSTIR